MTNPTQQLTEAEAVEIVAKRGGWTNLRRSKYGHGMQGDPPNPTDEDDLQSPTPLYLNSRDALQPVLEKLTAEEWMNLHRIINEAFVNTQPDKAVGLFWGARATKHLLTLTARTLCLAVAAAIKESAK